MVAPTRWGGLVFGDLMWLVQLVPSYSNTIHKYFSSYPQVSKTMDVCSIDPRRINTSHRLNRLIHCCDGVVFESQRHAACNDVLLWPHSIDGVGGWEPNITKTPNVTFGGWWIINANGFWFMFFFCEEAQESVLCLFVVYIFTYIYIFIFIHT